MQSPYDDFAGEAKTPGIGTESWKRAKTAEDGLLF